MQQSRHKLKIWTHPESGMTLLELLAVLAVMAVLAAVAVPALRPPGGQLALDAIGREIVRDAAVARSLAIRTGTITRLDVDLEARSIQGEGTGQGRDLPADLAIEAVAVHRRDVEDTTARFLFYPNGQSSGGTLTLRRQGQAVRIKINWVTGHAAIIS